MMRLPDEFDMMIQSPELLVALCWSIFLGTIAEEIITEMRGADLIVSVMTVIQSGFYFLN